VYLRVSAANFENDTDLTLAAKAEIDKMREQSLNLE